MLKAAFLLFLLVLFPVVGAAVTVSSLGTLGSASDMEGWPTVQGVVLSSEVVRELASTRGQGRRKPVEVYSAQVRYEYVVDGKTYQGDRIALRDVASTDRHQAVLDSAKFKVGDVTVYFNPQNPADALLAPQDTRGIIPGIVIGVLLMVVPPGMILVGLRTGHISLPEVPLHLRLWWDLKFGKYRRRNSAGALSESTMEPAGQLPSNAESPPSEEFIENVVTWTPGVRVELAAKSSSIALHLLLAFIGGVIGAWLTVFPVTHVVYQRETPHLPELAATFCTLLLATGVVVFFTSRLSERGGKFAIDWGSGEITARRDFSMTRRCRIRDVRRVVIQCLHVGKRPRKFRAAIELDIGDGRILAARTIEPRRKPESAKAKASQLADPLADSLKVPVEFEGWEE